MRTRKVLFSAMLIMAVALPVYACWEGCSPGYWKHHPGKWEVYDGGDSFIELFLPDFPLPFDLTLLDALNLKGEKRLYHSIMKIVTEEYNLFQTYSKERR